MNFDQEKMPSRLHIRDVKGLDDEVRTITAVIHEDFDFTFYNRTFVDTVRTFIGDFEGYQASNTAYHDMTHTLSVLLATARLLHGVHVSRTPISPRGVELALVCALMHDIGYIMEANDTGGTGAKYTFSHVDRGILFMRDYFASHDRSQEDIRTCEAIIRATDLATPVDTLIFDTPEAKTLAQIIASADLLAQMGDELYPEKLGNLFEEFQEAQVPGFESEYDLVRATAAFASVMEARLANDLGDVSSCMADHFQARWGADVDIYKTFIDKNISFLENIVTEHGEDYHTRLKRNVDRRPPFV